MMKDEDGFRVADMRCLRHDRNGVGSQPVVFVPVSGRAAIGATVTGTGRHVRDQVVTGQTAS